MHVFHIKGLPGLLLLVMAMVATLALVLLLPASFMMVLWNALVFEGLRGQEINLFQGFLLWGFLLVMIKLIFKPELKFQIQQMPDNKNISKAFEAPKKTEDAVVPNKLEETPAAPEQQN